MASRKGEKKPITGHRISRAFNEDMENLNANQTTAANQYEDGTRKLPRGDTVGNKKTMDQGKVSTEPT